ncbi:MAG: hypothetical protein M1817_002912 [Caeruleum heppii]|nr:MAG: hypothetical protein M1817_002912 [Caeruleum heppii]
MESPVDQPKSGSAPSIPPKTDTDRSIPILPSTLPPESASVDTMDVTSPSAGPMGPPIASSPTGDANGTHHLPGAPYSDHSTPANSMSGPSGGAAAAAAAATQQPKVVQTAFIHKLYSMLEDTHIQHLISWSGSNESFVMSPSSEFSKVLSQYFKHTNISSFVRQLNMYGFHKVSDVFHTGSPDSPLWEFKHGNGNFKRGDLMGLREIKRRASRHALINRESYTAGPKPSVSQPGNLSEPVPESGDTRLATLEHNLYDIHARLAQTEDNYAALSSKYQFMMDGLMRCHQWNHDLSYFVRNMVTNPEDPIHRDLTAMYNEIDRQKNALRSHDEQSENPFYGRHPHFSNLSIEPPLSPRQAPQDESQPRPPPLQGQRPTFFRPPVPTHLSVPQRRYGSVGHVQTSPVTVRTQAPPPPLPQPALAAAAADAMNLQRRHTSADIRLQGWQPSAANPFGSGPSSSQWPSSPHRASAADPSSQQVRDVLSRYEIRPSLGSRQTTPPLMSDNTPSTTSADSLWSLGASRLSIKATDTSAPPTRRSSMASNVHSLLNPAETAERANEDETHDDRKRKRLQ